MALTDPDDIIERLTKRYEQQLNLKDIITEEDLKEQLEGTLEGGGERVNVYMPNLGVYRFIPKQDLKDRIISNTSDLYETKKISGRIIENITFVKDLDRIRDVINKDVEKPLTTRIGIERAKKIIKEDRFSSEAVDAVEFLRKYSPQTLGGITVQEIRRTKSIQGLF